MWLTENVAVSWASASFLEANSSVYKPKKYFGICQMSG